MFANVINDLLKQASKVCYEEGAERDQITETLLENMKPIAKHFETGANKPKGNKYLIGNYITFVDFMLLELCERVQFITGRLLEENQALQRYYQNLMTHPKILNYMCKDEGFKTRLFNAKSAKINNRPERSEAESG